MPPDAGGRVVFRGGAIPAVQSAERRLPPPIARAAAGLLCEDIVHVLHGTEPGFFRHLLHGQAGVFQQFLGAPQAFRCDDGVNGLPGQAARLLVQRGARNTRAGGNIGGADVGSRRIPADEIHGLAQPRVAHGQAVALRGGGSITNCCLAPTNVYGSANISTEPVLVDRDAGDFCLQKTSPCINAGLYQSWMDGALDLDGRRRLDRFSQLVDIGCYEYVPRGSMIGLR